MARHLGVRACVRACVRAWVSCWLLLLSLPAPRSGRRWEGRGGATLDNFDWKVTERQTDQPLLGGVEVDDVDAACCTARVFFLFCVW